MTRDDIIKLAQESGLHSAVLLSHVTEKSLTATEADQLEAIIDFAERVAKAATEPMRADAERFQWIASRSIGVFPMCRVQIMRRGQYVLIERELRVAIDAARSMT